MGENLGTPDEKIHFGTAQELAGQAFASLSVLLVEHAVHPERRTPGLPDEAFIRGEVPMTKQEVRAAALAKLAVPRRYPVGRGGRYRQRERGAGTGRPAGACVCGGV